MKKFILFLIIVIFLSSCQKEYSYETNCGIVTGKKIIARDKIPILLVKYSEDDTKIIAMLEAEYNKYEVGDMYCK